MGNIYDGKTSKEKDNERKYLNNLVTSGGGNAEWAKKQLSDLDNSSSNTTELINKAISDNNSSTSDIQNNEDNGYINKTAELKKASANADFERAYNKILSNLQSERERINSSYNTARKDTSISNQIATKNYFENVANRGQTNSGSTAQGELALKIAGQNNLDNLLAQKVQAESDIGRRESEAGNDYNYNIASSNYNIETEKYNDMINQIRLSEEQKIKSSEEAFQREVSTIKQYYTDYTAEIQRRETINPSDPLLPYLRIAKQEKIDELKAQASAANTSLQKSEYDRALDIFKQIGYVPNEQIASILNLPVGTKTNSYKETTGEPGKDYTPIANYINNDMGGSFIGYDSQSKQYKIGDWVSNNQKVKITEDVMKAVNRGDLPDDSLDYLINLGIPKSFLDETASKLFN